MSKIEYVDVESAPVPSQVAFDCRITSVRIEQPQMSADVWVEAEGFTHGRRFAYRRRFPRERVRKQYWPHMLRDMLRYVINDQIDHGILIAGMKMFDPEDGT